MRSKVKVICGRIVGIENHSSNLTGIWVRGNISRFGDTKDFDDFFYFYKHFSPEYRGCRVVITNEIRYVRFFVDNIHQEVSVDDDIFKVDLSSAQCRNYEREAGISSS